MYITSKLLSASGKHVCFFFFLFKAMFDRTCCTIACVFIYSVYFCVRAFACMRTCDLYQARFHQKARVVQAFRPLHLLISHLHWCQCDLDGTKCYLDVSWFYFAFSLRRSFSVCLRNGCYFIVFYFNFVKKKRKTWVWLSRTCSCSTGLRRGQVRDNVFLINDT